MASGGCDAKWEAVGALKRSLSVGIASWTRLPGEKPTKKLPLVPSTWEQAHGVELHLRLITAMLRDTLREIQQRNCGGTGSPAVARSGKTR